ncbi:hypothetical protein [Dactylosporangium sp. CS-033363]|uniref:hypothetical protein n=1 Tax=Dactylosporangium sp. CS-033363 TaxID=3239935 RepID=UPI003D9450D8
MKYTGEPMYAPQLAPPVLRCRFCASVPAVDGGFQAVQNITVWIRVRTVQGPFCRDCGTAVFRHMQQQTLMLGWYGILAPFAALALLLNLLRSDKVHALPAPGPAPDGGSRRPMDAGKPLYARPKAVIGFILPIVLLVALIAIAVVTGDAGPPPS